jgi:TPR repeat protein
MFKVISALFLMFFSLVSFGSDTKNLTLAKLEGFSADASRSLSLVNVPDIKKAPVADYEMDEKQALYLKGLNNLYWGMQIIDKDRQVAANYFKRSAIEYGIVEARYFMGAMQLLENKLKEAESYYHFAMVQGSALAAFELGMMHLNKRDYEEARLCFKRYPHNIKMKAQLSEIDRLTSPRPAVVIRSSKAPAKLVQKKPVNRPVVRLNINPTNLDRVESYINALEFYIEKDFGRALEQMRRHEEQNMHSAEYVYMMGHVQLKNGFNEGLELLFNAALRGYKPAIFDLGLRYLTGDGVEKDLFAAATWFEKFIDDEKFKYHLGLALCQSIFPEDQEMGISLIEEAQNYPLAKQALNNSITMVHDEWGYYPAQAVGEN